MNNVRKQKTNKNKKQKKINKEEKNLPVILYMSIGIQQFLSEHATREALAVLG